VVDKIIELRKMNGESFCKKVIVSTSMKQRIVGLIFSDEIPSQAEGYLISPGNSIHTFFMNYPLDLVFLDKNFKVIKIIKNMKPWRMTLIYLRSSHVLEIKSGTVNLSINQGEQLEAVCLN
jgi:uncharacterized membrane protein (UPF0127 family)